MQNKSLKVVHVACSWLGGHGAVLFSLISCGFLKNANHHVIFAGIEYPHTDYNKRCNEIGLSWSYNSKEPGKNFVQFALSVYSNLK